MATRIQAVDEKLNTTLASPSTGSSSNFRDCEAGFVPGRPWCGPLALSSIWHRVLAIPFRWRSRLGQNIETPDPAIGDIVTRQRKKIFVTGDY